MVASFLLLTIVPQKKLNEVLLNPGSNQKNVLYCVSAQQQNKQQESSLNVMHNVVSVAVTNQTTNANAAGKSRRKKAVRVSAEQTAR